MPARRRRSAIYFMYDVKQFDPAEWSSPPLEGRIVDRPGVGKVMVGRGATNTKGPQIACLAALHAFKAAGREAAGQPRARRARARRRSARRTSRRSCSSPRSRRRCASAVGIIIPLGNQELGRRGRGQPRRQGHHRARARLVGEKWGRGPSADIHSSLRSAGRQPGVASRAGAEHAGQSRRSHAGGRGLLRQGAAAQPAAARDPRRRRFPRRNEAAAKKALGVAALDRRRVVARLAGAARHRSRRSTSRGWSAATPDRAARRSCRTAPSAKIDMRLVPDMTAKDTLGAAQGAPREARLRRHRGEHDRRLRSDRDAGRLAARARRWWRPTRKAGIDPLLWPRLAGSWPGVTFTGAPLKLPAGQFGLGHGAGAHAPDEYWLIESANPKVAGMDGAVRSFVELFYALGAS